MNSSEMNTLTDNINANIPEGVVFSMHCRSVDNHTFVIAGEKNGESILIEYPYKEESNLDAQRALRVAHDVMREYRFSHSCSQENAPEMKKRIETSTYVKREEVNAALGKDEIEKLESSIGYAVSECHKFDIGSHDSDSDEAVLSGYTVSIQNIDYVFLPHEETVPVADVDLALYDKALSLSYDAMKAHLLAIDKMADAMEPLGKFDPYNNAHQIMAMIDVFGVERQFTEEMAIGWNYSVLDEKSPLHVPEFCVNQDGSERYVGMNKAVCVVVLINFHPDFYGPLSQDS